MRRRSLAALATAALGLSACTDGPVSPEPDVAPPTPSFGVTASQQVEPFVAARVLVRFQPGAPAAQIASAQGAAIQGPVTLGILMLTVPAGRELQIAQTLARNPNVEFAEPDYLRTFGTPVAMPVNDPFIGYKWDLDNDGSIYSSDGSVLATTGKADADMDWKEAYSYLGGSVPGSAVVGVIDTGIRQDHEELAGRIRAQHDFFAGDGNAADDNGHGTHVAGIAAAATNNASGVAGVSFANTELVIAKVCGRTNRGPFGYGCPLSAIAQGITWAVDNGAHVLNLSLGGSSGSSSELTALQYARSKNVLPFCAAGNDGGAVSYPARYAECVAVSATDWGDNLASYSNFGPEVELSAPGGDNEDPNGYSYILSSYYESATSYAFLAGTSMASPQAAGLAALLHALGVTDDDDKLALMKSSADDLGTSGRDNLFGSGRINAHNAVTGSGGRGGGGGEEPANEPPVASFTHSCSDLTCSFDASGSTDGDGTIVSYAWTFGDGASGSGVMASHTYAAGGSYPVTLTVTDDDGTPDSESQTVNVSSSTGGIALSATAYKVRGVQHADLAWSGASSTNVDVYRNGSQIVTTANDGAYTDNIGTRGGGSHTYKVCEAGTATCSNQVTVTF